MGRRKISTNRKWGGGNTKQVEEKLAELEEKIKQLESANEQTNQKVESITKESLGLGNVDNTHDADKNVKTSAYLRKNYISKGTDLNDIKDIGCHVASDNATAISLKNCPTNKAFSLLVLQGGGTYQEITEYVVNNPKKWFRNMYEYGNAVGPWYRIYTEADPQPNLS